MQIVTGRPQAPTAIRTDLSAQPPYGTPMPQSGRRPQHQSLHFWYVRRMSA
jgi:hypothetical protein